LRRAEMVSESKALEAELCETPLPDRCRPNPRPYALNPGATPDQMSSPKRVFEGRGGTLYDL
jgi:hypothetical protein